MIDWNPVESLKIELNVNGWRDRSDTVASQFIGFKPALTPPLGYPESTIAIGNRRPAPNDARIADWDPNFAFVRNDWLYQASGRADWNIVDDITLTSITAYTRFKTVTPTDNDGTNFNNFRRAINARIRSIFQELRVAANFGMTKSTGGLNYQDDNTSETNPSSAFGSNNGVGPFQFRTFDNITNQQTKTYAAFGNVDLPITAQVTAQLGGRYTHQNRDYQGCLRDSGNGQLAAAIGIVPVIAAGKPYSPAAPGTCVTLDDNFNLKGLVFDKSTKIIGPGVPVLIGSPLAIPLSMVISRADTKLEPSPHSRRYLPDSWNR